MPGQPNSHRVLTRTANDIAKVVTDAKDAREREPDVVPGWLSTSRDTLKHDIPGALIKSLNDDKFYSVPYRAPVHETSAGLKIKVVDVATGAAQLVDMEWIKANLGTWAMR